MNSVNVLGLPITEEEKDDIVLSEYDDDKAPTGDQKISPLEPTNNSAINTTEEADLSYNSNSSKISKNSESKSNNSSRSSTTTSPDLNLLQNQIYFNNKLSDQTTMDEGHVSQYEVGHPVTNVSFDLPEKLPSLKETSQDNRLESEAEVADATIQTSAFSQQNYITGDLFNLLKCSSKEIIMVYPTTSETPFSCPSLKTEREITDMENEGSLSQTGKASQFGNDAIVVSPSNKHLLNFVDTFSSEGELIPVLNTLPCMINETAILGELLKEIEDESDDGKSAGSTKCEAATNMHDISGTDDFKETGFVTITGEREKDTCKHLIRSNELTHCHPTYCEEVGSSQNVDSVLVGVNNSVGTRSWNHNLGDKIFSCGPDNKVEFQQHTNYLFLNHINDEANNLFREITKKVVEILNYQKTGTNRRRDDMETSANAIGVQIDATTTSVRGLDVSSFNVSKHSGTVKDDGSSSPKSNTDKKVTQQEPSKTKLKPKKKKLKPSVKGVNKEQVLHCKFKCSPDSTISTKIIIGHKDPNKRNDVSLESKSVTLCKAYKSADSTMLILKRIKSTFDLCGWSAPSESPDILLSSTGTLHPFESKERIEGKVQDSNRICGHSGQRVIDKESVTATKTDRKKHKKEQTPARKFTRKDLNTIDINLEKEKRKSKDAIFKLKNIYGYGERCSNQIIGGQPSFVTFLRAKAIKSSETVKSSQSTKTMNHLCSGSSERLKISPVSDHCRQKFQYHDVPESTYIPSTLNEICDSDLKHDKYDICMDTHMLSDMHRGSNRHLQIKHAKQLGPQRKDQIVLPHVTNISNPWIPVASHVCALIDNSGYNETTSTAKSIHDNGNTIFHLLNGKGFNSTQQNATSKPSKNQSEFLPLITNSIANTHVPNKEGRKEIKLPSVHNTGGRNENSDLISMRKQPILSETSLKSFMANEKMELKNKFQPLIVNNLELEINNKRHPSNCRTQMVSKPMKMNIRLSPLTHRENISDLIITAKSFPKLDGIKLHVRKSGSAHSEPKQQCAVKKRYRTKGAKSHHYIKRRQSPKWHKYANSQVMYLSKAPLSDTQGVDEPLKDEDVGLAIRGLYPSLTGIQTEQEMQSNETNQMGQSYAVNVHLERTKKLHIRHVRWPFSRFYLQDHQIAAYMTNSSP
ncbi:hypothetical protein ACJMK2_023377 [Sinanodonta woodiana]|uniref:Uncharacterized protein n=1 Tax=Sinanodonta woodiana TaxID=1069815 RepID=A0ABD3T403_SINWO